MNPQTPTAQPNQPVAPPPAPQLTQQVPPSQNPAPVASIQSQRVNINPIAHLMSGGRNLFATNIVLSLVTTVISTAAGMIMMLVIMPLLLIMLLVDHKTSVVSIIGFMIGFFILAVVLSAITAQLMSRTLVTGSRKQKISLGELFRHTFSRLGISLLTYAMLFGIFICASFIFGIIISIFNSSLFIFILAIAFLIVNIILALRLVFISHVLADDEQPGSAVSVVKRSSALFKRSLGAVVIYLIAGVVLYIVVASITGYGSISKSSFGQTYTTPTNNLQYSPYSTNTQFDTNTVSPLDAGSEYATQPDLFTVKPKASNSFGDAGSTTILGSLILSFVVFSLVNILMNAGFAHIYNSAKNLETGLGADQSGLAPTAQPPMPVPPQQPSSYQQPTTAQTPPTPPDHTTSY